MRYETIDHIAGEFETHLSMRTTAQELYTNNYEPLHRTFRKIVGEVSIVFHECHNGLYELAALHRVCYQKVSENGTNRT